MLCVKANGAKSTQIRQAKGPKRENLGAYRCVRKGLVVNIGFVVIIKGGAKTLKASANEGSSHMISNLLGFIILPHSVTPAAYLCEDDLRIFNGSTGKMIWEARTSFTFLRERPNF